MTRRAAATALALIALAPTGCRSEAPPAAATTSTSDIVISVEPAKLPDHLAPNQCFAAVRGFTIVAEAGGATTVCDDLSAKYLRGLHQLSWPPPLLENPDGITECALEFVTTKLAVLRTTTNDALGDWAYDVADRMCSDLREDGWKNADWAR